MEEDTTTTIHRIVTDRSILKVAGQRSLPLQAKRNILMYPD
jgi:hypothetical protein